MADNLTPPGFPGPVATDEVGGRHYQWVKIDVGGPDQSQPVNGGLPVTGPLTDAQLRASPFSITFTNSTLAVTQGGVWSVGVAGTVAVTGPLTDAQLRATPVPISGSVTTGGLTDAQLRASALQVTFTNASLAVTGPLTDAQLRASAVSVSGPLTDAQLRASAVPVTGSVTTGGLTDAELRASALQVTFTNASLAVTGPLTDAQLRASAVPARIASFAYPISTANSSTAQLAAGATFTGTWETPQDQPSMSILLTSDQDTTITVQQAIDAAGTFRAPDIVFFVRAGEGFARSITINGNFVRLTAQNTGASTTTTFNLNVAFGSLGDADSSGTQPVTELPLVLTGQAAQTAVVNNILTPTAGAAGLAVSGFRSASVQVVSTGTGGTFIFEQSNDGVNWAALPVFNAALVTGVPITAAITATASQIIYTFPVRANFLRLRIATAITGGSIRAHSRLSTEPWTPAAQLVASNTAANLLAQVSGTVGVTGYPTAAASADALANPTVTKIDATGLLFNGTTWDRARNNINVAVEASSAKTASGNGAAQTNFNARGLFVWINVTAVTGTTPTLTVRLQWSPDGGTTWVDLDTTNAQTVSITGPGQHVLRVYPGMATAANASLNSILPRTWRLAWTIGGTTPSFTFAAQAAYVN